MNQDLPLNPEILSDSLDSELIDLSLIELEAVAGGPQLTNDGII
ncbi:hypothetical protein [Roseateles depolymerans]|nr:hypothetical protein [Roseateles depolymerans]